MSLKENSISGVKWNTLYSVNNALIQVVKLMILGRLLTKHDFGVIALASAITLFTEFLADFGLTIGMIHKQNISQKQYSSIFWLNLFMSIILAVALWLLSPLVANYYHEPILAYVIPLLGLQLPISAFGKLFYTFKTIHLEFKFISIVSLISSILGLALTIVLAWLQCGVYSLVFGLLFQITLRQSAFLFSGMKTYKVLFYCNFRDVLDFVKIGGFQVGTQVIDLISSKLDTLIIGRFFSIDLLGLYDLAKELIFRIMVAIIPVITSVATPAFAKIQDNLQLIQKNYLLVIKVINSINFPIFIAIALFAEPIARLYWGANLAEAAPFLRIFAFWGILYSISNPARVLLVALGRTDLSFHWACVRIVITTVSVLLACRFSIITLAWAQVFVSFLSHFLYWRMIIYPMSKIGLSQYMRNIMQTFLLALVPATLFLYFAIFKPPVLWSLMLCAGYFLLYLLTYFIFNKSFILEMIVAILPKKIYNKYRRFF